MAKKKKTSKKARLALEKAKNKLPSSTPEVTTPPPPITAKTIEKHREDVLSGARRFVYPLAHPKHKVVAISVALIVITLIVLSATSVLLLYRYKSTSNFAYQVSRVVPFPVARVNGEFVEYEDYLFWVRNANYYLQTYAQEGVDINSEEGKTVLNETKVQALKKVQLDEIARQEAEKNNIVVTDEEIDAALAELQAQGDILNNVLNDYYGWDTDDLRKALEIQLIREKIPFALDTGAKDQINAIKTKLDNGANFAKTAKDFSQDELTKDRGGVVDTISKDNKELPPQFVEAAFKLKEGEYSDVIETKFGLHIIKNNKQDGGKIEVAHILIKVFDVNEFLNKKLEEAEVSEYITLP